MMLMLLAGFDSFCWMGLLLTRIFIRVGLSLWRHRLNPKTSRTLCWVAPCGPPDNVAQRLASYTSRFGLRGRVWCQCGGFADVFGPIHEAGLSFGQ